MQKQTQVPISGLATNPNPVALPAGSCSVANNVVLRRPGVISALPAQDPYAFTVNDGPADTAFPVRLFAEFNRQYAIAVEKQPADANATILRFSDDSVLKTSMALGTTTRNFRFDPGATQHNYVRDRHIFTEHSAPVVVDTSGAAHSTTARPAGLPPPTLFGLALDTVNNEYLLTGNYVAYRAVYRRVFDTFTLVSAPTPTNILHNTAGASRSVRINTQFVASEPIQPGDFVDFYRTPQKATVNELGDNFSLVFSYQITAADIAAHTTTTTLWDPTAETSLSAGEPLYTNDSQQGAGQANLMPPASVDVETFNDVTFYATKNAWPIISFSVPGAFGDLHLLTSAEKIAGIGHRVITGTSTAGSPTLTGVANVDGIAIGQIIPGFNLKVVSITGTGPFTVQFDGNFTLTGTLGYDIYDAFTVRVFKDGASADTTFTIPDDFFTLDQHVATVPGLRTLLNGVYDTTANITGLSFSLWFPYTGFADRFEVYATNGQNYSPYSPFNTSGGLTKFTSTQDTKRNRVYFSKAQLPEAVAPTNYLDVGKETVIKLKRTQSSLLAFCTDGQWRITGSGTDWSVDQLDPDCRLVHPDCVGSVDNTTFAWVLDGLATCGDDGSTTISTNAVGPEIRGFASDYIGFGAPYIWGPHLACDLRNREVWLNLGYNAASTNQWNKSYIFNVDTQQFTTQSTSIISAQSYAPSLLNLLSGSISANSYSLPSTTEWLPAEVQFNPIVAGDRGYLKQWVDINAFFENTALLAKVKLTFNATDTAELTRIGDQLQNLHFFVPRHCASRPELQFGFKFFVEVGFPAPNFDLYGWTARYRVASETIRR